MNTFEPPKSGSKYKTKRSGTGTGTNGHTEANGKAAAPALDHRSILSALRAFKRGDFDVKMREDLVGVDGQIAETFNELVEMVKIIKDEASDVSNAVGKEGQANKRMRRLNATGGWANYISAVNEVITDLTGHANEIARVVTAVARGDLEQTMELDDSNASRRGEFLRHARIVNGMVARLSQFGSEVTRVALEVGGEGKLGAQARVQGVSGVWKDLTDSVNLMASNLTSQVREIARVTTAIAQGDLTKTVTIDVKGEILDDRVDRGDVIGPATDRVHPAHALAGLTVLTDGLAYLVRLFLDRLHHRDHLVEGLGDLAVDAGHVVAEANVELAAAERAERRQQLAPLQLVPLVGLDGLHGAIAVGMLAVGIGVNLLGTVAVAGGLALRSAHDSSFPARGVNPPASASGFP